MNNEINFMPTIEGIMASINNGTPQRVSFSDNRTLLHIRYGQVDTVFPVNRIPATMSLNLSEGMREPREKYLQRLFEHVLYASMEFYVLGLFIVAKELPIKDIQQRMRTTMLEGLCKLFSAKVRNRDIAVKCDDENNPPSVVAVKDIRATVFFNPVFGSTHFYPISISLT